MELKFPARLASSGSAYQRFIPRYEMDIAVVGVGAAVTLDETGTKITAARIGLGSVGPTPIFAEAAVAALVGQAIGDEVIRKAAEAVRGVATPIDDMRGTKEFLLHVTGVLVERVLEQAIARAREVWRVLRREWLSLAGRYFNGATWSVNTTSGVMPI